MTAKKKPGRPKYEPTDQDRTVVKLFRANGKENEKIAAYFGICVNTLKKHFQQELEMGLDELVMKVAGALVRKALGGDTTAMIFFLKCKGGWIDNGTAQLDRPLPKLEFTVWDGKTPLLPELEMTADDEGTLARPRTIN